MTERALDTWLLLDSGLGEPAVSMATDEALLESSEGLGMPVLRFYGWTLPAASFGYFQRFSDVEHWTSLRPLVRRPTGGGIVPHEADWTYSVIIPPTHEWHGLAAIESYRRIHEWLQTAFARVGVETLLAPEALKSGPGRCFAGYEQFDLLWRGRKIAGAAQRRNRLGLLAQGSVQPPPGSPGRKAWKDAMLAAAERSGVKWKQFEPSPGFDSAVRALALKKYFQDSYNRKR